jgi:hypothetical protein
MGHQTAHILGRTTDALLHNLEIFEAPDGQSGLALYRSRWIDRVVLELGLPD